MGDISESYNSCIRINKSTNNLIQGVLSSPGGNAVEVGSPEINNVEAVCLKNEKGRKKNIRRVGIYDSIII